MLDFVECINVKNVVQMQNVEIPQKWNVQMYKNKL